MKCYFGFILCLVAGALLCGCKPSEKNYRLAYETAQAKAREGLDDDVYEAMLRDELPPLIHIMGDSVRVQRVNLNWFYTPQSVDSGKSQEPLPYNLAVALYKMPVNARAHANDLAQEGYASCVMRSGTDKYYVIAARSGSLDSIAHASSAYIATHEPPYPGLPCVVALQR